MSHLFRDKRGHAQAKGSEEKADEKQHRESIIGGQFPLLSLSRSLFLALSAHRFSFFLFVLVGHFIWFFPVRHLLFVL